MSDQSIFPDDYGTRHNAEKASVIYRAGYVVARDQNTCAIKVSQPDKGIITPWLRVMQHSTGGSQSYHLPREGEFLHLLHVPGATESALILGSTYTDQNPPPVSTDPSNPKPSSSLPNISSNAHYKRMDDGTELYYDPGDSTAKAAGKTPIPAKLFINSAGPIEIHTAGQVNIIAAGYANITCSNAKIQAAGTEITGNVTIDQDLTVIGKINVDNIHPYTGPYPIATPNMHNADGSSTSST
jgi:phage baseplate assembly protein V